MNTVRRGFFIGIIAMLLILNVACNFMKKSYHDLPIYNARDMHPELVDSTLLNTSKNHRVLDFTLINQNADTITENTYRDKIYITDFIFTQCKSMCPLMTANMVNLQNEFLEDDEVLFLSLSVTPEVDNVDVLKAYALKNGIIDSKWNVTTGNKKHIYELARRSYFAVWESGDGGSGDFIHTSNFILVDKKKRIRGIYHGINDDEIKRLVDDIRLLMENKD